LGHRCAYCGEDLSGYRNWLSISLDHVIPRQSVRLGWVADWIEDMANLVPCCRACNEFTNAYKILDAPPPDTQAFFDARDRHFLAKIALTQAAHAREREFHAANVASGASVPELIAQYVQILDALRTRGVIRSQKVVADYAEAIVIRALALEPANEGTRGFDARDPATGSRIQIKARQVAPGVGNLAVGPFRDLAAGLFDELVGVVFESDFSVRRALRVPLDVVRTRSIMVRYDGAARIQLGPELHADPGVRDVTDQVRAAAAGW
jgi:hypothetical protein